MRNILSSTALLLVLSSGVAAQRGGGGGGHQGGGGGGGGHPGGGGQSHPPQQQPRPQQSQHQNPPQQQPQHSQPRPTQQPRPRPTQQPRPTQAPWQGGKPNNGNRPGDKPRGGDRNPPWGNGPRPGDRKPDWNNGKGSDWGRGGEYGWNNVGGRDGGWRDGRQPQFTTIGYNPGWNWNQPNYYEPVYYTSYIPTPTWEVPSYPIITIEAPPIAQPDPGCVVVPTTQHTVTETEATYTSTITEAPNGAVTVYVDQDGQQYTYGASTIYEVYVYTTTQSIDLVGDGLQCGAWKRRARRTASPLTAPAYVEARATGVM